MRYILNSAVITSPGIYQYVLITPEEAGMWIQNSVFESTIGYPETAIALTEILGIEIPVNRKQIKMQVGDEALVFRLTCRLDDPRAKGEQGIDFIRENCEIGLLIRRQ